VEARWRRVARTILADVLAVGSVATGAPALSPVEEEEVLDGIEFRLEGLLRHMGPDAPEADVRSGFRAAHPDLYEGTAAQRHARARRPDRD
jgi:hypothetical protein